MTEPYRLSATEAAAKIRDGSLTSETLVQSCLERIAAREGEVGAWAYINPEQALAEARARDKQEPKGLLHGIPVGMKDVIDTADMPTEYGSPIYAGNRPAWDAAIVAQVREAGGVILGKVVTTEFATRYAGKTRNPVNLDHTPGGSSSGTGASVGDSMVPIAFGTQTTGSLIRPASYCGVIGHKPTFNMFDRAGMKPLAQSFDTLGVHVRDMRDAALMTAALADYKVADSEWDISPPKLAFCRTPVWDKADASTQALLEGAAATLGKAGAAVTELTLPDSFANMAEIHTVISEFEFCRALAYERINFPDQISEHLTGRLNGGLKWTRADYEGAWAQVRLCDAQLGDLFKQFDAILAPSVPGEAPRFEEGTGSPIFSQFWTPFGLPCVNVPALEGPQGLPVGVQILTRAGTDARALCIAEWARKALLG